MHVYLSRAVIIPFAYKAPPVQLNSLNSLLSEAHRALPEAISIGKWLIELPQQSIDDMVKKVHTTVLYFQFLRAVAPNIKYHIPKTNVMIEGVEVRLNELAVFMKKHHIPHKPAKEIRKKAKKDKRCAPRMKQFFLKEGKKVSSNGCVPRKRAECKGCLCFPSDCISTNFAAYFKGTRYCSTVLHNKFMSFEFIMRVHKRDRTSPREITFTHPFHFINI